MVITSPFLVENYGWRQAESICSIVVAIFIIVSLRSLFKDCLELLLLQTPAAIDQKILDEILRINEVLSYSEVHFWSLSSSKVVGTVHIQVTPDAEDQKIREKVRFCQSPEPFYERISTLILDRCDSGRSSSRRVVRSN